MARFPFDHLTLAEVAEFEAIVRRRFPSGRLYDGDSDRYAYLAERRHRPIYPPAPPPSAA